MKTCQYCNKEIKNGTGMSAHIRAMHPEYHVRKGGYVSVKHREINGLAHSPIQHYQDLLVKVGIARQALEAEKNRLISAQNEIDRLLSQPVEQDLPTAVAVGN